MNPGRAEDVLRILVEQAAEREHVLSGLSASRYQESDDEADAECPIIDSFYGSGGNEAVLKMCKSTLPELQRLYAIMQECIVTSWNVGRKRRSTLTPMDILFMCLVVLKHGGSWDALGTIFCIKGPTFMRLITQCVSKIVPLSVERFVKKYDQKMTMQYLNEKGQLFINHPYALEAIDVTFQQSNRPSGNMQEGKNFFSGKHKLYGYKVEVAVRPNGFATAFSAHFLGSTSDLTIMHARLKYHEERLKKREDEENYSDNYAFSEEYQDQWSVIIDKGYQSASEVLRAIIPKKKPLRGILGKDDERFNKQLSSDRIIVENYFDQLGQLWAILSSKFVWSEKIYDGLFSLGGCFTNFHISIHKLRDGDGDWYNRHGNRLSHIGESLKRKRVESQDKYRKKRKLRLTVGYCSSILGSDEETQEAE